MQQGAPTGIFTGAICRCRPPGTKVPQSNKLPESTTSPFLGIVFSKAR